jgi:gamma-glutamylcyclotransferase (GGCT)/AIG2-like uncharacterized protein YtfP
MKVFVYGTLRTRESRNHVMRDADFMGMYKSLPLYTMYDLGSFPAISEGGKTKIVGELYEVDDYTLEVLDMIEGHPTFYKRQQILLGDEEGLALNEYTEAYFLDRKGSPKIKSGDWYEQRKRY